ncbi:hypothetical protein BU23DRAFT_9481 [Bimuria novae-zelandiae CBS 107.79]|uniref:Uncharacterized protein n=1 Tax=Bimuria novae-zelandiae CBS 107.79 TaxID=1447943 RepID=A0A6A5VSZ3_9PLEO|nr:hypothetical protein BU23DRAFT_9481 [Bimuria novae-zelandiae CBS 107.79]
MGADAASVLCVDSVDSATTSAHASHATLHGEMGAGKRDGHELESGRDESIAGAKRSGAPAENGTTVAGRRGSVTARRRLPLVVVDTDSAGARPSSLNQCAVWTWDGRVGAVRMARPRRRVALALPVRRSCPCWCVCSSSASRHAPASAKHPRQQQQQQQQPPRHHRRDVAILGKLTSPPACRNRARTPH